MHVQVVLMHALARAKINIFTPWATQHQVALANGVTDGASLKKVSHHVARDFAPRFHHFLLFLQLVKLFLVHHGQRPPSDTLS